MSETSAPAVDFANLDEATFARLYRERIEPCFRDNEDERVAAVESYKRRLMIGAPAVLATAAIAWSWSHEFWFGFFAIVFLGVIAFAIAYGPLAAVGKKVKQAYCAAIADAMGASFKMGGFDPPALERMKHLRLLPGYARSSFEDLFSGSYQGCPFDLYEAHLEERHTDSKGRTRYVTVFRGQLIRMQFPRKFLGITVVRRDAGVFNVFGGGFGLKRVGLEDPLFEKAFEVWGNDQVGARYILHPVLMQRLLDLETRLKGKRLRCAFEEGDLLVAVEGGNLFEPGDLFKPLVDQTRARRIVDEISSVVRVMEQVITAQARR